MIHAIVRPNPAGVQMRLREKYGIALMSECYRVEFMEELKAMDIRFVRSDELSEAHMYWGEVQWPDGQYQYFRVQAMKPALRDYLDQCVLSAYGPIHVKIWHMEHYGNPDGNSCWVIGFFANSILAQRYALMSEEQFGFMSKIIRQRQ